MGVELQKRGHTVFIGTDSEKEEFINAHNLNFLSIEGSIDNYIKNNADIQNQVNTSLTISEKLINQILEVLAKTWFQSIDLIFDNNHFDLCILPAMSVFFAYSTLEKVKSTPFVISNLFPMNPTKYFAPPSISGDYDSWFQIFNQFKVPPFFCLFICFIQSQ